MITDEKMVEMVASAQDIVRKGFGRMAQFPEHQAIESPVIAVVLAELIRQDRELAALGVTLSPITPEQAAEDKKVGM